MARYLVGDIQGCAAPLKQALKQINFDAKFDELWCVGDIIGRGPSPLECLELIRDMGTATKMVLGNHDLNLLAVLSGVREANPNDRLDTVVNLPESEKREWIDWLVQHPLLIRSEDNLIMTHAGIYPWWSVSEAESYAKEVSEALQQAWRSNKLDKFLVAMYGNEPTQWSTSLEGMDRIRFFINVFTRMRFCDLSGHLNFSVKQSPDDCNVPAHLKPWFELWDVSEHTLVFGHWAALMGKTLRDDVIGLDTGCVWGEYLTVMRWPDGHRIKVRATG
ncbi:MAG: bis(5'-nucleosyl)-tetraphosphatase [Idiomarina sp.]|nr:MAG: bis(5'-nucleosyl)-tetraphosphatase [Idiomarina sp.]